MKKEELLAIGLTEEQTKQVMALRGKAFSDLETDRDALKTGKEKAEGDLIALKAQNTDVQQKLDTANQQLTDANAKLASQTEPPDFQAQIDVLKQQLETSEHKRASIEFDSRLKDAIGAYKPKNASRLIQILNKEKISADGDKLNGLEEQIAQLKESDAYLFEDEVSGQGGSHIESGGGEGKVDMNQAIRSAAGK